MNRELKDILTLVGAFLSALYLALQSVGIAFDWFNPDAINAWVTALGSFGALIIAAYGIYKNTYVLTKKGRNDRKIIDGAGVIKPGSVEEVDDNE